MKAWVLHDINDIRFEDVAMPVAVDGEVLVKVEAAGICGSDIPRVFDTGAHKMPLIIGHEFSGTVVDTGKRVGIFPLIPCKKCKPCLDGHYEMCRNYSYLGSRRDGAFAEYVSVPVWNLIELPDSVSFEEAAMLEPMSVAVHAMRIALGLSSQNRSNDILTSKGINETVNTNVNDKNVDISVVVCGLGTIGFLLTQFLRDAGYKNLYVIGNKDLQKSLAIKIGIAPDHFCDSRVENAAKWLADKTGGTDLFFECVGRNECISLAVDSAAPSGRIVLVGNPYSDITFSRNTYWKILRNQLTVLGTWNSSFSGADDDWHYVLERLATKKVDPSQFITHRFNPPDLDKGLEIMRDKKEEYCKVMTASLG